MGCRILINREVRNMGSRLIRLFQMEIKKQCGLALYSIEPINKLIQPSVASVNSVETYFYIQYF